MSSFFATAPLIALPKLPQSIISQFGQKLKVTLDQEVERLRDQQILQEERRDATFRETRKMFARTSQILFAVRTGDVIGMNPLIVENKLLIGQLVDEKETQREGNLGQAIESFTEARLLQHFFATGKLGSQTEMQPCNDEEYIGGMLGFAQELSRYAVGRASEGDSASIELCRLILIQLNKKFLEFNFRNGILRRKYDGLKYALRNVENIAFELGLVLPIVPPATALIAVDDESIESALKRCKTETVAVDASPTSSLEPTIPVSVTNDESMAVESVASLAAAEEETISSEENAEAMLEMEAIRLRMDANDALREEVIKLSRDAQKLAKQAIFGVQRGGLEDARSKLVKCQALLKTILLIVDKHPPLRFGSVSACLEEWAEGMLTLEWAASKRIMSLEELSIVDTSEYVGALSDFTGEIGRMAVALAGKRELEAVREVLQADVVVASAILTLNTAGKYTKKADAVNTNLKKVEDIVYELSLLKRGGRAGAMKEELPPAAAGDAVNDE